MNRNGRSQRILVTGSQGYIGTQLVKELVKLGADVTGTDIGYFENTNLVDLFEVNPIKLDIRNLEELNLSEYKCIVHLAALSNDPLGEFNTSLTYSINRDCAVRLARQAKKQGVNRFIFASTQSIYGVSESGIELNEDSEKRPVTAYAKSKWEAEQDILSMATNDFVSTAVRPSTVFGWGARVRNDIIFNNMISSGIVNGEIKVHTDGTPYRPVVHISDVVDFIIRLLDAATNIVRGQAYNLGQFGGNFTVLEIAQKASECLGGIPITLNTEDLEDQRSYKVSFEKAVKELGFVAKKDLTYGGKEIITHFNCLDASQKEKYFKETTRLSFLKRLIERGSLNPDLSWT